MGSRVRAAAPGDDAPADSLPPTAASFWDEDSGSLQAPMQAPADAWRGHWEPASVEPAPVETAPVETAPVEPAPPTSAPRRHGIPRPRLPSSLRSGFAPRRRGSTAAILGLLAASVVVVLAVIGETEGGTHNAGQTTASASKSGQIVTAGGANVARLGATPVVTPITDEPARHYDARTATGARRSHARGHRADAAKLRLRHRRPVPRPTHSTSQAVHTTAPTYTPAPAPAPTTSTPSSSGTSSSPPASTGQSTTSSTQHQPAFGSSGSLGPGSSPDS